MKKLIALALFAALALSFGVGCGGSATTPKAVATPAGTGKM